MISQKKVSMTTAALACAGTLLTSVAGSVAWATQFQTKTQAAAQAQVAAARTERLEGAQHQTDVATSTMKQDLSDVKETVSRVEDKVDRLLLRVGR